ncbi:MAG: hypothetical protein N3A72_03335 [bacterium]|nr:hypothetical protein [bacterium]
MELTRSQKGSTNWILIVLLVIAIVLAICFYTQKRIIEKDRDNLAAELQSSKDTTSTTLMHGANQELESLKKQNQDLAQQLTFAHDSIKQLQSELADLKKKQSQPDKKPKTTVKKPTSKTSTKKTTTAKKTKK